MGHPSLGLRYHDVPAPGGVAGVVKGTDLGLSVVLEVQLDALDADLAAPWWTDGERHRQQRFNTPAGVQQTLLSKATYNKSICRQKEKQQYNPCRYSKDVHRTKCKALTITRLTHSPYTTKIARVRDATRC